MKQNKMRWDEIKKDKIKKNFNRRKWNGLKDLNTMAMKKWSERKKPKNMIRYLFIIF